MTAIDQICEHISVFYGLNADSVESFVLQIIDLLMLKVLTTIL